MDSKLTVQQALNEGFEHAGRKTGEYQRYVGIKDLSQAEIEIGNWFVVSKEKLHPSIDSDSLKDLIVNEVDGRWYDETRDDDSTIDDALHELDLTELANKINESLKVIWCSKMTDIQLINQVE